MEIATSDIVEILEQGTNGPTTKCAQGNSRTNDGDVYHADEFSREGIMQSEDFPLNHKMQVTKSLSSRGHSGARISALATNLEIARGY